MNFLLPFSVTGGTVLATLLFESEAVGHLLLATLVLLGVLEHWMLVLPFAPTALWGWALRSRNRAAELRVV
jgi:hypothetical protein